MTEPKQATSKAKDQDDKDEPKSDGLDGPLTPAEDYARTVAWNEQKRTNPGAGV